MKDQNPIVQGDYDNKQDDKTNQRWPEVQNICFTPLENIIITILSSIIPEIDYPQNFNDKCYIKQESKYIYRQGGFHN